MIKVFMKKKFHSKTGLHPQS